MPVHEASVINPIPVAAAASKQRVGFYLTACNVFSAECA